VEQMMGHAGGLAQTYAKANEEYRRAAIEKLELLISSDQKTEHAAKTSSQPKGSTVVIQFPKNRLQSA
jgi:hypothetical protein